jgi:hypothetical protein
LNVDVPFQLLLFIVVFAAVGGISLWTWWNNPKARTKRQLQATPRTNIAAAADGATVKVIGKLKYVGKPLHAPLSGRNCAYFEVRVQEHRGKNNWKTIVKIAEGSQFFLHDGTGKALVKLGDLTTAVVEDIKLKSGFLNDPSEEALALLQEHGQSSITFLGTNKTIRYFEGVLEEDESIAVYGQCSWEADPDPGRAGDGYRDGPQQLRVVAPSDGPMLVSDDPEVTG